MRLYEFLEDVKRVLKVVRKPSREEYWVLLRVCVLGITIIGVYGFIILYLATVITATMGF